MKIKASGKMVIIPINKTQYIKEGKFANWRYWEIGDIIKHKVDDPIDGYMEVYGKVTKKYDDHIIIHISRHDYDVWCDDDFEDMFERWDWRI